MKVRIVKGWYGYFFFVAVAYIVIMSVFQLISEFRAFSAGHILLCLSMMFSMRLSFNCFRIILRAWAILLILSGGLILLSTLIYLLSGAPEKISLVGNALGAVNFAIGFVLNRYFEASVHPAQ